MVTITKNICRKLSSKIYGINTLYTNTVNKSNNDFVVRYTDINTKTNTLYAKGYRGMYKYGLCIINRELLTGRSKKYNTVQEAKEAHRAKSLSSYHKKQKQYRKDIDKSLSQISNKKLSSELSNFFAKHYQFNYFTTLTFQQIRFTNKEKIYSKEEYEYAIQQDYINNQNSFSLEYVQQCVTTYLNHLKYKNKQLADYYFVTYEKTIVGDYHAHIALQISNTTKRYWTTYLTNNWHYGIAKTLKIRKNTSTKDNTSNVLDYLTKDIEHKDINIVHWDTNITKNSKRIFNLNDLNTLEDIEYWLATDNKDKVLNLLPHLPISNIKQTA